MPGVVQQYFEALKEVESYAQEHGQDWEIREAFDDNLESWRRAFPDDTHTQTFQRAIESTKHEINESYERESEREIEGEARAEREGIHINQLHARYESPSLDASEHTQNLFAEESEAFVEKQLRAMDRQFPNATEVERLRITENRLGLDHRASERIQTAYNEAEQPRESNRESVRIQFG